MRPSPSSTGKAGVGRRSYSFHASCWLASRWPDEVPFIARDVEEYSDVPVGLRSRLGHEHNARCRHARAGGVEVLDANEESDPSGGLTADDGNLVVAVGLRQENAGLGARRPDYHPALGPPSLVVAGESSASSNPSAPVKKPIAWS